MQDDGDVGDSLVLQRLWSGAGMTDGVPGVYEDFSLLPVSGRTSCRREEVKLAIQRELRQISVLDASREQAMEAMAVRGLCKNAAGSWALSACLSATR